MSAKKINFKFTSNGEKMPEDKMVTYLTRDPDQFLDSLKNLTFDEIKILIFNENLWIGYTNKGSIIIQQFKSLEELMSYFIDWNEVIRRGKNYGVYVDNVLASLGKEDKGQNP